MAEQPAWDTVPPKIEREAVRAGVTRAVLPNSRPTSLRTALTWVRGMLAEGWYVDYDVDTVVGVVWLKLWEYGDPEPAWDTVKNAARPSLVFSFAATAAAREYCESIADVLVRRHGIDEPEAVRLLDRCHSLLPWLNKPSIDPMQDDLPEYWAERLTRS